MIILDPVAISDATFTRASTGPYFDADGVLQTAAIDALRVTYDPADLTAAPHALIEGAATNLLTYSDQFDNAAWNKSGCTVVANATTAPDTLMTADSLSEGTLSGAYISATTTVVTGSPYTLSVFAKRDSSGRNLALAATTAVSINQIAVFDLASMAVTVLSGAPAYSIQDVGGEWYRCSITVTPDIGASLYTQVRAANGALITYTGDGTSGLYVWGAQLELGSVATSYTPTVAAAVTRAADIIGSTGTVLGSNVAEADAPVRSTTTVYAAGDQVMENHAIYESKLGSRAAVTMTIAAPCVVTWTAHGLAANTPVSFTTTGALPTGLVAGTVYYVLAPVTNTFNVSATAGGAAINTSGSQSGTHTATASLNLNKAVSDTVYWLLIGATNQRKMVDAYNNTRTENADAIILVMTPRQISQGFYLGGLDANEVSVVVQDPVEGIVYSETQSLVISDSGSSFFNWCFKRIRRKTYFFTGVLPVYYNAIVAITIKKPGAIAKCGMCALGPLIDVGLSQYGLSREIKDYSSSTFNFDGTSTTVERGYAKLMSVDISIKNELIDSVIEQLEDFRQRPVVYIGAKMYGSAIVFGKYSSFKSVIRYLTHSQMALNIQGTV